MVFKRKMEIAFLKKTESGLNGNSNDNLKWKLKEGYKQIEREVSWTYKGELMENRWRFNVT